MEREPDIGLAPFPLFRLAPVGGDGSGVWCDEGGVFIGPGIALVARRPDDQGQMRFAPLPVAHLSKVLSSGYDEPVDAGPLLPGLARVAAALENGDLALANIALVHLRIAPFANALNAEMAGITDRLLKADWDEEEHPRYPGGADEGKGGQFAPKDASVGATTATAAAATGTAAGVRPLFGDLLPDAIAAFSRLAAGVLATSVSPFVAAGVTATAFLGVLFVPSNRSLVSEGKLPDLPDTSYRYDDDTRVLDLWRGSDKLFSGQAGKDGIFRDETGNAIGRVLDGSLALDPGAVAAIAIPQKRPDGDPGPAVVAGTAATIGEIQFSTSQIRADVANDNEPKACPDPGPDRPGGKSQDAINYQVQISGLPILPDGTPMAVLLNGVMFDGCRLSDGHMLEAKGIRLAWALYMPFVWLFETWNAGRDFLAQAKAQSAAAPDRVIEWHFAEPQVAYFFKALFFFNKLTNVVVKHTPYERPAKP
jgi:hypothetical protein